MVDIVDALKYVEKISKKSGYIGIENTEEEGLHIIGLDPTMTLLYDMEIDNIILNGKTDNISGELKIAIEIPPTIKKGSILEIRNRMWPRIIAEQYDGKLKIKEGIDIIPNKHSSALRKAMKNIKRQLPDPTEIIIDAQILKRILRLTSRKWKIKIKTENGISMVFYKLTGMNWKTATTIGEEIELKCQTKIKGKINEDVAIEYRYLKKIVPLLSNHLYLATKPNFSTYIGTETGIDLLIAPIT